MTAQLQYRRTTADQANVIPHARRRQTPGGPCRAGHAEHAAQAHDAQHHRQFLANASATVKPIRLRAQRRGRTRASSASRPIRSTGDVPAAVVLRAFPALRDVTPSTSHRPARDDRLHAGRSRSKTHTLRAGGDFRLRSIERARPMPTPHGAFVFTGLYASGGGPTAHAAAASTSPTSCSACRSRRRSSTARARSALRGRSMSLFCPGRLAQEREADVQSRRALRADLAVREGRRPAW